MTRPSRLCISRARSTAASLAAISFSASPYRYSPARVSRTPWLLRSMSRSSSRASSAFICFITAAGVIYSFSAA